MAVYQCRALCSVAIVSHYLFGNGDLSVFVTGQHITDRCSIYTFDQPAVISSGSFCAVFQQIRVCIFLNILLVSRLLEQRVRIAMAFYLIVEHQLISERRDISLSILFQPGIQIIQILLCRCLCGVICRAVCLQALPHVAVAFCQLQRVLVLRIIRIVAHIQVDGNRDVGIVLRIYRVTGRGVVRAGQQGELAGILTVCQSFGNERVTTGLLQGGILQRRHGLPLAFRALFAQHPANEILIGGGFRQRGHSLEGILLGRFRLAQIIGVACLVQIGHQIQKRLLGGDHACREVQSTRLLHTGHYCAGGGLIAFSDIEVGSIGLPGGLTDHILLSAVYHIGQGDRHLVACTPLTTIIALNPARVNKRFVDSCHFLASADHIIIGANCAQCQRVSGGAYHRDEAGEISLYIG